MMTKIRLTDVAVQKLRSPDKGRNAVQDELVPNLWLRITDKGHKSWAVAYRYNGKPKRLTLGNYPAVGISDARQAARDAMQKVARGEDPHYLKKEKIEAQKIYTFATVVEDYIERYAKPKNRTWLATQRLLYAHAVPVWGEMPMTSISRRDVIALLDKMMRRHAKQPTRHLFAALRKLFNWVAERNLIEFSPCAYVKSPIQPNNRDRVLKDDEIKAIWQACVAQGAPFGALVQVLLLTGQRLNEVARMRWNEVDFKENLWRLPRERVKVNRSHEIPLSPLVIEILQSLPRYASETGDDGDHFVFTTTGGRRPFSGFSKCKARLDKDASVYGWRIHDLRRTCGTNLAKLGIPVSTISQVLNHAQGGVTAIYNRHSYLPEKRIALEKWAQRVTEIAREDG